MAYTMNYKQVELYIPSPIKVFFLGISIVFIDLLLIPADFLYLGSFYSWFYLFISVFALLFGLILGQKNFSFKSKVVLVYVNVKHLKRAFYLVSFFAILGVLLRLYDKFFIRGLKLKATFIENREILQEAGVNIFSVISVFLYPLALFLPFLYLLLKKTGKASIFHLFLTLFITILMILESIIVGSRSLILILVLFILFYLRIFKLLKFSLKNSVFIITLGIIFVFFTGYIFDLRTRLLFINPIESTQLSAYATFLPLREDIKNFLYSIEGTTLYFFILGVINIMQYIGHAIFELLFLVDNFNTNNVFYGKQNFAVILKFIYFALGIPFSLEELRLSTLRFGIYTTLFGPIYYDFTFFGFLFTFIIGYITGYIYNKVIKGNIWLIPLIVYNLIIIFLALVVNVLTYSLGLYIIFSYFMFFSLIKISQKIKLKG